MIIILVNIGTYFIFLDPARNPISFECDLPDWLHYEDEKDGEIFIYTSVKAVFEPVARRTLLMWIMFSFYCLIIIIAVFGWLNGKFF